MTPNFPEIISYIYNECEIIMKDASKRVTIGNHILPFPIRTYIEVSFSQCSIGLVTSIFRFCYI